MWFRRLAPKSTWRKLAIPTAVTMLAQQAAILIPLYLAIAVGLTKAPDAIAQLSRHEQNVMIWSGFGISILTIILGVFVAIPANVILTRVQASILSDTDETIIPFDRTFKGKVVPEIVGGTGVIGMADAWNTFDWAARVRLVKIYAKVFAMQLALGVFFIVVLCAQLWVFIGKDLKKAMEENRGSSRITIGA